MRRMDTVLRHIITTGGKRLIIVAKTTWLEGLHFTCFVFGGRVQIWAQKCYPEEIRFASLPPGQHNSA